MRLGVPPAHGGLSPKVLGRRPYFTRKWVRAVNVMARADFLRSLQDGSAPRELRLIAAKGLTPLPPREALNLLAILAKDPDADVAKQAAQTVKGLPEAEILAHLRAKDCAGLILELFATAGASDAILEAVVTNPSTPGTAVAQLASTAPAPILETILYNRVRLLECPAILESAKLNPGATAEARRLIQEVEQEFFGDKKKEYIIEESKAAEAPEAEPVFTLRAEPMPEDLSLEGLPSDPEERESAILDRLSRMTVPEKIKLALMGTREVRNILIRDTNRLVAKTVLESPKLSENEVEAIAAMRNVSEEVLRDIGSTKAWTRCYAVVKNLVKNPKTPPTISQRLLFRLQSKDLMLLAKDRAVPEAVRQNALRSIKQRSASKTL